MQNAETVLDVLRERHGIVTGEPSASKVPAGFGGRLRGKGPRPITRERNLAAQPILLLRRTHAARRRGGVVR